MERQADLMIYITRTRFLDVMISQDNEYFYVRLEICFVIMLDHHLHFLQMIRLSMRIRANGVSRF